MKMAFVLRCLVTLTLLIHEAYGDFNCVCNYNIEANVYPSMDTQTTPIGSLYEFDCKPQLSMTAGSVQWVAVAFQHQVGYMQTNSQLQIQTCSGEPVISDVLTTKDPQNTMDSFTLSTLKTTLVSVNLGQTSLESRSTSQPTTPPVTTTTTTTTTTTSATTTTTSATTTTTSATSTQTIKQGSTTSARTTKYVAMDTTSVLSPVVTNSPTSFSLGDTSLCSATTQHFASSTRGYIGQFRESCYVIAPQIQHWSQAQLSCNSAGGHLVDITNSMEQNFVYNFLLSKFHHSVWIGLNDKQQEGVFQWSSGQHLNYTNWAVHNHFSDSFEDCVVMDTRTQSGKWDDRECDFESYSYICEFDIAGIQLDTTTSSVTFGPGTSTSDGNIQLCPRMIRANGQNVILAQYGKYCYELLLNSRVSWEHAENLCSYNGGHLTHVDNAKEQAFIDGVMSRHNPNHAVWLGLHDTITEGHFQWTSGDTFQYSNWLDGHNDNTLGGHNREDCVTLVPQRGGKWDDVTCGYEDVFGPDTGEVHYAFCQYKIHPTQVLVG